MTNERGGGGREKGTIPEEAVMPVLVWDVSSSVILEGIFTLSWLLLSVVSDHFDG